MALLRAVQPDVKRPLVREALDILTPALPTRLAPGASLGQIVLVWRSARSRDVRSEAWPAALSIASCSMLVDGSDAGEVARFESVSLLHPAAEAGEFPKWSRYVKKVSNEEAGSLSQLVHIWATIVRHADMFTSSRGAFTPQMVHSLQRLGESALPCSPQPTMSWMSHGYRGGSVDPDVVNACHKATMF